MDKIFIIVSSALTLGAVVAMANDVFMWSVSNQVGSKGGDFATRVIDLTLSLPLKILTVLLNMVLSILEGLLNAVFKFLKLGDVFKFDPITL